MYCQVCGSESTEGLNYCKRCGANLTLALQTAEPSRSVGLKGAHFAIAMASLSLGTAVVSLGGLGLVLGYVEVMAREGPSGVLPKLILLLGLPMVFATTVLLVWQISRLIGMPRQSTAMSMPPPRPHVSAYAPVQIAPPLAVSSASVTEHTTRTFDARRVKKVTDDE
jgi:hypothetical protein